MRVLLSEASSLSAREHLTVLAASGVEVEAITTEMLPIARFSRWCARLHRLPRVDADPVAHLRGVAQLMESQRFDALLPTHEQAWLYAEGRRLLPPQCPVAVSSPQAFARVQGKIGFAHLADELGLSQPRWRQVSTAAEIIEFGLPCWLKLDHSTAGAGVAKVSTPSQAAEVVARWNPQAMMAQDPAIGGYAQVAALFDHGRLVAAHCSAALPGTRGAGGSAAARIGVDHPQAIADVTLLGAAVGWHGGLTLDYLHHDGVPTYLECNARTTEPANAFASGVDLPMLTIALSRGDKLPDAPLIGRPGVRTHTALNMTVGCVGQPQPRIGVLRTLGKAARWRLSRTSWDAQVLPLSDPPSVVPVLVAGARVLVAPDSGGELVAGAANNYQVPWSAIETVRAYLAGAA